MGLTDVERTLGDAVAEGVVPGGVLLVADGGQVVLEHPFGSVARLPEPGPPVTVDTIYDVASLTKPVATVAVILRLLEAGRLALDTPALAYVPELALPGRERIRVRDLLAHASGLPAHRPYYERLLAGERLGARNAREALLRMAAAEPLESEPGARSVYSDLGFIVLGFVAERCGGERLDRLASRAVFEPLGMRATRFIDLEAPTALDDATVARIAPTELCPRRGLLRAQVHDDNAHAAGGVLGHAGLFSTASDLSRLVAAHVSAWRGERTDHGLPPAFVQEILAPERRAGLDLAPRLGRALAELRCLVGGRALAQERRRSPGLHGLLDLGRPGACPLGHPAHQSGASLSRRRTHPSAPPTPARPDRSSPQRPPRLTHCVAVDTPRRRRYVPPAVNFPALLAVPVEIRALDAGSRVDRVWRLAEAIGPKGLLLAADLPFEQRRPVAFTLALPPIEGDDRAASPANADQQSTLLSGVALVDGERSLSFTSLADDAKTRILRYVEERILTP